MDTQTQVGPPPLPLVPDRKGLRLERIVNSFLIAVLAFILGAMIVTFQKTPDAVDSAEEAIGRIIRRDYEQVANDVLLDVIKSNPILLEAVGTMMRDEGLLEATK